MDCNLLFLKPHKQTVMHDRSLRNKCISLEGTAIHLVLLVLLLKQTSTAIALNIL